MDLSKNQLTVLPDDLGRLGNLQHLDLYNNKLTILPVSFSQLKVGNTHTHTHTLELGIARDLRILKSLTRQ